jgi:copper chaperone CopZ
LPPSSIWKSLRGAGFVLEHEDKLKDWKLGIFDQLETSRLKRLHLKHCQLCQVVKSGGERLVKVEESMILFESNIRNFSSTELRSVNIENADDPSRHAQRIYLSISGMTCASCVGAVTDKIKEVAGVSEVAVDFIGKSAAVVISRKELADDVTMKIEEAGFEAEIVSSESLSPPRDSKLQPFLAADVIIHNMGASCIGDIQSTLQRLEFVRSIEVVSSEQKQLRGSLLTSTGPTNPDRRCGLRTRRRKLRARHQARSQRYREIVHCGPHKPYDVFSQTCEENRVSTCGGHAGRVSYSRLSWWIDDVLTVASLGAVLQRLQRPFKIWVLLWRL